MKFTIVGIGYVGMSVGMLLAQFKEVVFFDIDKTKIINLNNRISPIEDLEVSDFLSNEKIIYTATANEEKAYNNSDYIIIATPTDYDVNTNYFDTSSVEVSIEKALKYCPQALIVIRSTVPVGYIESIRTKFKTDNIIFSPEFLREGKELYDNL